LFLGSCLQRIKKLPTFFGTGTQRLTTFPTRPRHWSLSWARRYPAHNLPVCFLKICSNIILLSTSRSSNWYLPFRFYRQNPVRVSLSPQFNNIKLKIGRKYINKTAPLERQTLSACSTTTKKEHNKKFYTLPTAWFLYVCHKDNYTSKKNFTHKLKNSSWREAARHVQWHLQNYCQVGRKGPGEGLYKSLTNLTFYFFPFLWSCDNIHNILIFMGDFFPPIPPHVPYELRALPSRLWPKCNRLLRLGRPWGSVTLSRWGGWWYLNMK
jgi:hypothetical protein